MNFWAITTYYNPVGWATKLRNFKAFHARLGLPLVVVEHVLPGCQSELTSYLAQSRTPHKVVHVIVNEGDVMWQKERLLNVALIHVPQDATHIIWIDNDLLFSDGTWLEKLAVAFEYHPIVQCFAQARMLIADVTDTDLPLSDMWFNSQSSCKQGQGCPGRVWAGRADILRKHGFYDAMILDGGDRVFERAARGHVFEGSRLAGLWCLTPAHAAHCDVWCRAFYADLKNLGPLGWLDNVVYHLWHGEFVNREYTKRQHILAAHDFDPNQDICISEAGAWSWASDKPELHQAVRAYFQSRREDPEK